MGRISEGDAPRRWTEIDDISASSAVHIVGKLSSRWVTGEVLDASYTPTARQRSQRKMEEGTVMMGESIRFAGRSRTIIKNNYT